MKKFAYLMLTALLIVSLAGCTPVKKTGGSSEEKPATSGEKASTKSGGSSEKEAGVKELRLETDGEKAAVTSAETELGRKWASGDWQNGTPVKGDAMLVGYGIVVHDGTTQYQVKVMDGTVVKYFGSTSDVFITGQYSSFVSVIGPSSDQQQKAWDAALAEVKETNPNVDAGGIEYYLFYFPKIDDNAYPAVAVYAKPPAPDVPYAMGGPEFR